MWLSDLQNVILIESGEHLFSDVDQIQLNMNAFWRLTQRVLKFYEKFVPVTKELQLNIWTTPYNFLSYPPYIDPYSGLAYHVPEWISRVVIAQLAISILSFYYGRAVIGPMNLVSRYFKPVLYVSFTGQFQVRAHYPYTCEEVRDPQGNMTNVNLHEISESDYRFINLLKWNFLRSVARSRKAFLLNEVPVISDAQETYAEASNEIKLAEDDIRQAGNWWESIGT